MLSLIFKEHDPILTRLQKTHFRYDTFVKPRNYQGFYKNRSDSSNGGVAVFITNNVEAEEIPQNTNLEAVAVSVTYHQ